jgi:hypothetical protein
MEDVESQHSTLQSLRSVRASVVRVHMRVRPSSPWVHITDEDWEAAWRRCEWVSERQSLPEVWDAPTLLQCHRDDEEVYRNVARTHVAWLAQRYAYSETYAFVDMHVRYAELHSVIYTLRQMMWRGWCGLYTLKEVQTCVLASPVPLQLSWVGMMECVRGGRMDILHWMEEVEGAGGSGGSGNGFVVGGGEEGYEVDIKKQVTLLIRACRSVEEIMWVLRGIRSRRFAMYHMQTALSAVWSRPDVVSIWPDIIQRVKVAWGDRQMEHAWRVWDAWDTVPHEASVGTVAQALEWLHFMDEWYIRRKSFRRPMAWWKDMVTTLLQSNMEWWRCVWTHLMSLSVRERERYISAAPAMQRRGALSPDWVCDVAGRAGQQAAMQFIVQEWDISMPSIMQLTQEDDDGGGRLPDSRGEGDHTAAALDVSSSSLRAERQGAEP